MVETNTPVETTKEERTWGMLCHLVAFAGFIIPLGSLIGPLAIWLIKKNEMPFVDDQGKESLNFQISMVIAALVSMILIFVAIGYLLLLAVVVYDVVMVIIASMKANEGVRYRYPYALRLLA